MTTRTASLLFLFVAGLMVSAVLLAGAVPAAAYLDVSTPWLVPTIGIACFTVTFLAGRSYILPHRLAASVVRAGATLLMLTTASMAVAFGTAWGVQVALGRSLPGPAAVLVWFATLWLGISALHGRRRVAG